MTHMRSDSPKTSKTPDLMGRLNEVQGTTACPQVHRSTGWCILSTIEGCHIMQQVRELQAARGHQAV